MPKKNTLSIKIQGQLLRECIVRGKENKQLQVILDCDNMQYYINRSIELLREALDMKPSSPATDDKLKLAQILINITRAKCKANLTKSTDAKVQKP